MQPITSANKKRITVTLYFMQPITPTNTKIYGIPQFLQLITSANSKHKNSTVTNFPHKNKSTPHTLCNP
jgi:hypothetical protein